MDAIQIVTVVNNHAQYERYIKGNPYYKNFDLACFDNTKENLPVPLRYNHFIDTAMLSDAWVVFCHQDFSVNEDLSRRLSDLDRRYIYGPSGTRTYPRADLASRIKGVFAVLRGGNYFFENKIYGRIMQGCGGEESKARLVGRRVKKPLEAVTVDGCCLIIHSSLIREHGLRFDEGFGFSLFGADLSIMARKRYNVKTKILPLKCFHLSEGRKSAAYFRCLARLIRKYPDERIAVTFSNEREVNAFQYFFANRPFGQAMERFINVREEP